MKQRKYSSTISLNTGSESFKLFFVIISFPKHANTSAPDTNRLNFATGLESVYCSSFQLLSILPPKKGPLSVDFQICGLTSVRSSLAQSIESIRSVASAYVKDQRNQEERVTDRPRRREQATDELPHGAELDLEVRTTQPPLRMLLAVVRKVSTRCG